MNYGDHEKILKECEKERTQLWNLFERKRSKLVEIARYLYPAAIAGLTEDVRNLRDSEAEYDDDADRLTGVPFDAFRIACSGFYVNLTNPARPWFRLTKPDFREKDPEETDWEQENLQRLTDATKWLIGWCGGYRTLSTLYKHLVAFGFGAILASPDDERHVRTECLRMGTYALGVDRKGKVDRVVRHFAYTAEQMIEEYGAENCGLTIRNAAKNGDRDTLFEVWNLVTPHRRVDGVQSPYNLDFGKFSYRSVHWTNDAKDINHGLLAVRGYEIKPLVAPRLYFENGEIYGRGCGHDVLGRCRGLQTMCESQIDIADQAAHPAMMAPASMADDGLRLEPLAVNYYPDSLGANAVYPAIPQGSKRGELTQLEMQRLETEIRKDLFNSEFETINALQDNSALGGQSSEKMTATEVRARVSEKMEQLAGIATTLNDELLDPLVTMMAAHAVRAGLVDQPEAVSGIFDIKYESTIHAAANAQPINACTQAMGYAFDMAQMTQDPSVMDNFDLDKASRDIFRKLGADERYLRKTAAVEQIRQGRAQAQAAQAEAEQQSLRAKAMKDAMSAPISPETLGGALAQTGQETPL